MKKYLLAVLLATASVSYADPGIMIDIDIIIDRPTGSGEGTMV